MMKKEWTREEIKEMLKEDDVAVYRGILAIYNRQTVDEQATKNTHHHNGVGFSGIDAEILSSFAEQIGQWKIEKKHKRPLSPKQMVYARKKIVKYSRQLAEIANSK